MTQRTSATHVTRPSRRGLILTFAAVLLVTFATGNLLAMAVPKLEAWLPASWVEPVAKPSSCSTGTCGAFLPCGLPLSDAMTDTANDTLPVE